MVHKQDIDIVVGPIGAMFGLDYNYNEIRGCSLDMSIHRPRSSLMSLSECNKEYHIHIKCESDRMVEDKPVNSSVKNKESGLNIFPIFFSYFYFIFDLFFYSIFRTRVRVRVTRSRCHTVGHIRWHSHKSHDAWKDVEGSKRIMSYNVWYTC